MTRLTTFVLVLVLGPAACAPKDKKACLEGDVDKCVSACQEHDQESCDRQAALERQAIADCKLAFDAFVAKYPRPLAPVKPAAQKADAAAGRTKCLKGCGTARGPQSRVPTAERKPACDKLDDFTVYAL